MNGLESLEKWTQLLLKLRRQYMIIILYQNLLHIFRNSPSESFPLRFVGFSRQKCFRHWMSWFSDITRRIVDWERCDAGNVETQEVETCRMYMSSIFNNFQGSWQGIYIRRSVYSDSNRLHYSISFWIRRLLFIFLSIYKKKLFILILIFQFISFLLIFYE